LVDQQDNATGYLSKSACHDGEGQRHRAFSIFIFNNEGAVLLQQRAAGKRLWPNFWSNSCCSHPRRNESMTQAVQRRCEQELGFSTPLEFLYQFEYREPYKDIGTEHELCSVFAGTYEGSPIVNSNEIKSWRWVSPESVNSELKKQPHTFTPWFKLEWHRLLQDFSEVLLKAGTRT
jgi:isopentenyl-diphosphate Delta-isomerase